MKNILTFIAIVSMAIAASAQQDITSLMTSPTVAGNTENVNTNRVTFSRFTLSLKEQ